MTEQELWEMDRAAKLEGRLRLAECTLSDVRAEGVNQPLIAQFADYVASLKRQIAELTA